MEITSTLAIECLLAFHNKIRLSIIVDLAVLWETVLIWHGHPSSDHINAGAQLLAPPRRLHVVEGSVFHRRDLWMRKTFSASNHCKLFIGVLNGFDLLVLGSAPGRSLCWGGGGLGQHFRSTWKFWDTRNKKFQTQFAPFQVNPSTDKKVWSPSSLVQRFCHEHGFVPESIPILTYSVVRKLCRRHLYFSEVRRRLSDVTTSNNVCMKVYQSISVSLRHFSCLKILEVEQFDLVSMPLFQHQAANGDPERQRVHGSRRCEIVLSVWSKVKRCGEVLCCISNTFYVTFCYGKIGKLSPFLLILFLCYYVTVEFSFQFLKIFSVFKYYPFCQSAIS